MVGVPPSCAHLQPVHGFHCYDNTAPRGLAISAHDNSGEREMLASACTRSMLVDAVAVSVTPVA